MNRLPADQSAVEAARTARRLLAPVKEEIISLLQKLVRTNTVAVPPKGNEAAGQKVLVRELKARKIDVEMYDTKFMNRAGHPYARRDRDYTGRPNVIARLTGSGRGRSLLFNGHMDTVPPGPNRWKDSPWSGNLVRGRLYGRGSFDMKGGIAAQFGVLLALRRAGLRLGGDLLSESVVDEEWGGGGGTLAARLRGDRADACSIGEVTGLELVRATRGGWIFQITARAGDPSRYFSKEEVIGPAVPMGRLLGWVDRWAEARRKIDRGRTFRDFPDPAPVQVLALEANRFDPDTPWSVPMVARVLIYFQFLPHEDVPAIMSEVRDSFREFCSGDSFFRAYAPEWRDVISPPLLGHELEAGDEWVQCMARSASAVLRRPVVSSAAQFPCDAFLNQNEFNIPTVVFGPSGAGAHNQDEYVTIRSVIQTAETLLTAALTWCNSGNSEPDQGT
jgi:acetylornithine deacetylase